MNNTFINDWDISSYKFSLLYIEVTVNSVIVLSLQCFYFINSNYFKMPLGRKNPKANKVAALRKKENEEETQLRREKNR